MPVCLKAYFFPATLLFPLLGPDGCWGLRLPGSPSHVLNHFCQYTNFDVLEKEYTKMYLSCTAIPIINATLAFLRADFFRFKPC